MKALEWGIQSIVEGVPTDRIKACTTEAEARDWVMRFPQSYRLVSRSPWLPDPDSEAHIIATAILTDNPAPYKFHYHDLPSRRINLNVLAAAYAKEKADL